MAALITFLANQGHTVNNAGSNGSGLGFYGSGGYSSSVQVGAFPDNTYITDATGTASSPILTNNVKWISAGSGQVAGNVNYSLQSIPNYLATLNIRFTNDTPVKCQNAQFRIFDRNNIDVAPTGVLTKVAIISHPAETGTNTGSGDSVWQTPGGSGSIITFNSYASTVSPGASGLSPSGSQTSDTIHDFYLAISPMVTSIGSKLFAASFSLEFI